MTARATKGQSTSAATGARRRTAPSDKAAGKAAAPARAKAPARPASRRATGSAAAKKPAAAKAKKPTAAKKPAATRARKPKEQATNLREMGGRVLTVHGPFGSRTMVDLPTALAEKLFGGDLSGAAPSEVLDAVAHDVDAIRERDEDLANSALAATAAALAREIQSPFNSATSKSMCAAKLMEALAQLRELLPPKRTADAIDQLAAARSRRRAESSAGSAAAAD